MKINFGENTVTIATALFALLFIPIAFSATSQRKSNNQNEVSAANLTDGLRMTVQPSVQSVALNVPVVVTISLANMRRKPLLVRESDPLIDFGFQIKNSSGENVPLTALGMRMQLVGAGHVFHLPLGPGQTVGFKVRLDLNYDLSQKGTYSITVKRSLSASTGKGYDIVTSNIAKVTVK